MSSPYDFVNSTGIILVDTSDTLTEVQDEYKIAFNNTDLVVDSGPLSVLINAEVQSRNGVANSNAQVANQINPNIAGGVFLDAIASFSDIQRTPGTPTTVLATLNGIAGTLIPGGSLAQSTDGTIYESTADATIGGGGTIDQTFQATVDGPINLAIGSLNQIVSAVLGWEGITNAAAGTAGQDTQSDESLRNERNKLLGLQSASTPEAIFSNVEVVSGVNSLTFRENITSIVQIIDGVTMEPHSIFVCVDGGTDNDVALAILQSKSSGSDWNGTVFVDVTEPISGQNYLVQFERPTVIPIFMEITINPTSTLTNPTALAREAIIAYANGEVEGFDGFVTGADAQPFVINDAVNIYNSSLNASRLEVGLSSGTVDTNDIPIEIFEIANVIEGNIVVIIV